jgi:hypothetical protein
MFYYEYYLKNNNNSLKSEFIPNPGEIWYYLPSSNFNLIGQFFNWLIYCKHVFSQSIFAKKKNSHKIKLLLKFSIKLFAKYFSSKIL